MLSEPLILQDLMNKINLLSSKSRLQLIQCTCDSLTREQDTNELDRPLQFGEFAGERFSTWEDFKIAEWRPTDEYLNRF
jgi:hypothetical protein